jgi:hypothetical protein
MVERSWAWWSWSPRGGGGGGGSHITSRVGMKAALADLVQQHKMGLQQQLKEQQSSRY